MTDQRLFLISTLILIATFLFSSCTDDSCQDGIDNDSVQSVEISNKTDNPLYVTSAQDSVHFFIYELDSSGKTISTYSNGIKLSRNAKISISIQAQIEDSYGEVVSIDPLPSKFFTIGANSTSDLCINDGELIFRVLECKKLAQDNSDRDSVIFSTEPSQY